MNGPRFLLTAFSALLAGFGPGTSPRDEMVRVGSHRLQARIAGDGAPAVVIDAGLGDSLDKWVPLQARLSRVTRVVVYDRAGYGRSEPGPLPRDAAREAEELRLLLEKAGVPGPYVLVGHSLGGLNVQILASRHPELVAGLLLLDPPPLGFLLGQDYGELRAMAESMTSEWEAAGAAAARSSDPKDGAASTFLRTIASEHREMFGRSARDLSLAATFGELPLVVMASGRPNPAFGEVAGSYQRYWVEQSRLVSLKSSRGRFILAPDSSHALHLDAPDRVAEAVLSLVEQARAPERVRSGGLREAGRGGDAAMPGPGDR